MPITKSDCPLCLARAIVRLASGIFVKHKIPGTGIMCKVNTEM